MFKEVLPTELARLILKSNAITVRLPEYTSSYRYYLGRGNNAAVVNRILQSRGTWVRTDNMDNANFVWAQTKKRDFIKALE